MQRRITGQGSLTVDGPGTLILTNTNNNYSGGTTITGGMLEVGDGVNSPGSITGDIADAAALIFDTPTAASLTFNGNISGLGSVEKDGDGTLTLSGSNGYACGITISGGTLEATTPAALPAYASVHVNSGATLAIAVGGVNDWNCNSGTDDIANLLAGATFDTGSSLGIDTTDGDFTYAGNLGGPGQSPLSLGLVKLGQNTLTLTGANDYQGGTTITDGTLRLGDGQTSPGSVVGDIVDNTSLVFANPDTVNAQTYYGVISGGGTVTVNGPGTLILTGASTYTGVTTINGCTLQLGDYVNNQDSASPIAPAR